MHLVEQQPQSTFTTQELARLEAYRAAVAAGFYTDWDGTAASTDTFLLARLLRAQRPGLFPFTAEERRRLGELRTRFAAGEFGDDRPPTDGGSGESRAPSGEPGSQSASQSDDPGTRQADGPLTE